MTLCLYGVYKDDELYFLLNYTQYRMIRANVAVNVMRSLHHYWFFSSMLLLHPVYMCECVEGEVENRERKKNIKEMARERETER